MKHKVFFGIAVRIIVLFSIGMAFSFIPDNLRGFFGDVYVERQFNSFIEHEWQWGVRHYWYFCMMFFLFILSAVNTALSIARIINREYGTKP